MDELVIGAISVVVICVVALSFLLAPCGNLRCYMQECGSCESGEVHLTKAIENYKEGFGVNDQELTGFAGIASKFSSPGARLFFVLAPILIPLLLLLYFFFFTDAGHMVLGMGMVLIGLIVMLVSVFSPSLYRLLMPIGAVLFTMGVVMFTFS